MNKQESLYSRDLLLVFAASFCYMCCPMMVTPVVTGFTESLGGSGFLMGFMGGLMNLVSLGCRPLVGNLADRLQKYHIALAGAAMLFFSCLGYFFSYSPGMLLVSRIINGAGFAFCSVSMSTWFAVLLPKNKVGFGMGLYGTAQAFSMAIGPSIGIQLKDAFGYRAVFLAAAVLSFCAFLCALLVKDHGHPVVLSAPRRLQLIDIRVIPIALIVMLFTIPYSATQSFLVSFVEAGTRAVQVDLFFPSYALIIFVLRTGFRNYFDRVPYRIFLMIALVCSASAMLTLNGMQNNFHMFLAAAFLAGSYGLICSVSQATAIIIAGEGKRGLANSTYYVGLDLGLALGPILGGMLYESIDLSLFYPAFLICTILCIVVYICFRKNLNVV